MSLTPEDLAYMRETQAEARTVAATLKARAETSDGMGGKTTTLGDGEPVMIRLDGSDSVPDAMIDLHGADLVKVTMDLVPVFAGDQIILSATEAYEVVTHMDPDRWATAQVVYAVRVKFPQGATP